MEISPPPGFDPRTVQPVNSRYNNYATRPTLGCVELENSIGLKQVLRYTQRVVNKTREAGNIIRKNEFRTQRYFRYHIIKG